MQYKKPLPWDWNPNDVAPRWQAIARSLVVGYPMWSADNNHQRDIGPLKAHAPVTISGTGGMVSDTFGHAFRSISDNDYINTGRHYFRRTSFFADTSQEWTMVVRFKSTDTTGTIFAIGGATSSGRQVQLYYSGGNLTSIIRGTATALDSTGIWIDGNWHTVCFTYKAGVVTVYSPSGAMNLDATPGIGAASEETSQYLTIGARTNGSGFLLSGTYDYFYGFDRALNQAELESLCRYPYELLKRDSIAALRAWIPVSTGSSYTLEAAGGSYGLSGQVVDLPAASVVGLSQGEFTQAGQGAGLITGKQIATDSGSIGVAGQVVGLLYDGLLSLAQGSITATGQSVVLAEGQVLSLDSGSLVLSGQAAGLLTSAILNANNGALTLSGQEIDALLSVLIAADQGALSVSGQEVTLTVTAAEDDLVAASGAFSLSGQDAEVPIQAVMSAAGSEYSLSGQDADVLKNLIISPDSGSFSTSGFDVSLVVQSALVIGQGEFVVTGYEILFPDDAASPLGKLHVVFIGKVHKALLPDEIHKVYIGEYLH